MSQKRKLTIACIAADILPNQLGGAEVHAVEVKGAKILVVYTIPEGE